MRRLIGCCSGLLIVCFAVACVGGVVLAAGSSGATVVSAAPGERVSARPDADPSSAAAYDNLVADFAKKLSVTKADGPAPTLVLTRQQVTARINKEIPAVTGSQLPGLGMFLDFQSDRLLATIRFDDKLPLELRVRVQLVPNGSVVRAIIERADIVGLFPIPINVTDLVKLFIEQSGTPLEANVPFLVQSIQMQGGSISISGLPK